MSGTIKIYEKKVILHKIETTEGTDAAPVSATDAIQVLNYQPRFMDSDTKVRNIDKGYLGADPVLISAVRRGASFEMEMHGGGATAITVPPWMKVLRIGGMDAGVPNVTKVDQKPVSDVVTASHWSYIDDFLMKIVGARATIGYRVEDDEFPVFMVDILGRAPATLAEQVAPTSPTLTGYVAPVLASTENTTFTLDSFALALRSMEMSNNADLQFRSLIGPTDRVQMRERPWAGTIVGRVPDLTTKDYFANIRPGTTMASLLTHGTVAGNIVEIAHPKLQLSGNVDLSEEGGELMMTMPVTALPNVGNDEIVITSK